MGKYRPSFAESLGNPDARGMLEALGAAGSRGDWRRGAVGEEVGMRAMSPVARAVGTRPGVREGRRAR